MNLPKARRKRKKKHNLETFFFIFEGFGNLEKDFSIVLNVSEQLSILSKLHYKTDSKRVVAMSLHQTYCLVCICSYVFFFQTRGDSELYRSKEVLFYVIKTWYYLEYVFTSSNVFNSTAF